MISLFPVCVAFKCRNFKVKLKPSLDGGTESIYYVCGEVSQSVS